MSSLVLVRTGTANLASVLAAFRRLGFDPEVTTDPDQVASADLAVLPGVGAFGASRAALEGGLDEAIRSRVTADRPLLAVCVGLQLLCRASEESPGVAGLGVVDGSVGRFATQAPDGQALRVPHMGWTAVTPTAGARWLSAGFAYFAHSYRLDAIPEGWEGATAEHGVRYVAGLERGAVLALQCHPELSGAWGQSVLEAWAGEA